MEEVYQLTVPQTRNREGEAGFQGRKRGGRWIIIESAPFER